MRRFGCFPDVYLQGVGSTGVCEKHVRFQIVAPRAYFWMKIDPADAEKHGESDYEAKNGKTVKKTKF